MKGMKPLESIPEMIDLINAAPIGQVAEPGKLLSYSNESYALLGEIVHRVSGLPYEQYVTEQILKPAGMTNTVWDDATMADKPEYATLYSLVPQPDAPMGVGALATPVWWNMGLMSPAGALRSTVQEMLRFSEIFRTGGLVGETRLLSEASVKAMMTPYIEADAGVSYGYGLMIKQVGGQTVIQHGGANKGVSAIFSVIPEQGLTGVGLANAAGVPSELVLQGALNLASGLPLMAGAEPKPTIEIDAEKLAAYAGTYAGGEAAPASFTVENGALVFDQMGMKFPMRPVGPDLFAVAMGPQEVNVRFIADEAGKYHAISIGFRIWQKL
jgi:CubicO group peptidase (beta-lactamase class C family)